MFFNDRVVRTKKPTKTKLFLTPTEHEELQQCNHGSLFLFYFILLKDFVGQELAEKLCQQILISFGVCVSS